MATRKENWDDLRYFLSVARQASPTRAAAELGVSYVTVLRRLNALEASVGVRLFRRDGDGYVLTQAGAELRRTAEAMERSIRSCGTFLRPTDRSYAGELRVATGDGIGLTTITKYLPAFRERYPDIRLELNIGQTLDPIGRGDRRVHLRPMRATTGTRHNVFRVQICGIGFAFYAAEAYLSRAGRPMTPFELSHHTVIGGGPGIDHLESVRWIDDNVTKQAILIRADSLAAMYQAVKRGVGAAALPCIMGDEGPGFVRLFEPQPALSTELWAMMTTTVARTARARAFVDFLIESAERDRDWLLCS